MEPRYTYVDNINVKLRKKDCEFVPRIHVTHDNGSVTGFGIWENYLNLTRYALVYLMFIGPCIIVIVEERKTNLMSLAILFHFLCAQHVSDIHHQELATVLLHYHIGRLVLSSLCVGVLVRLVLGGVRVAGFSLQNEHHPKLQNWSEYRLE